MKFDPNIVVGIVMLLGGILWLLIALIFVVAVATGDASVAACTSSWATWITIAEALLGAASLRRAP